MMHVRHGLLSIVPVSAIIVTMVPATAASPVTGIAKPGDDRVFARYALSDEPSTSPDPSSRVTIIEKQARWDDMMGVGLSGGRLDPSGRGGPEPSGSFYLITGKLRNETDGPLRYVKLAYELLDGDGNVVHRESGYNRKAEALRDEGFESGSSSLEEKKVEPVAPGETETFRMFFFREDLPRFEDFRVQVEAVVAIRSGPTR